MAILVSAYQLEKTFASRTLFRDLTFAIETGDRIGLIGPNGAGKSTLMKIIAQKSEIDGGKLSMNRGLRVGFLEQTPAFNEAHTVYEAITAEAEDPYDADFLMGVDTLLSKLSLGDISDKLVSELSGGWRKRVALARELAKNPDLLLLDEPTNHLDLDSILWLEEFLANSSFAVLTVTHDRLFLQRVANRIFDLDKRNPNGLLVIKGDYSAYLEAKDQLMHAQARREEVLSNTLRRETEWLRRGAKARITKQQARIDRAGQLKDEVEDLRERNLTRTVAIDFHEAERNPQKLVEAKGVTKAYDGHTLFKNLDLLITPKTRLGLLGSNGAGKSSLIRVLLGQEKPDTGTVTMADKIQVAYFEQHREELDPNLSVIKTLVADGDYVNFRGQYIFARSYLDRFLFRGEQMDMPVAKLSGGEQARLRIAQLMLTAANVLVLDEPTNDLDMATLNVLEENLREFNGAVILVTHDRYFLDQVSNTILAFTKDDKGEPELLRFADYLQWEAWKAQQGSKRAGNNAAAALKTQPGSRGSDASALESSGTNAAAPVANTTGPGTALTPTKQKRKLSFKEQREFDSMEENIQKLEAKLQDLEKEAAANASHAAKLSEIYASIAETQKEIERLYARWSELE